MNKLSRFLIIGFLTLFLLSCQKQEINSSTSGISVETKAVVLGYDNFYDSFDWSFTNNPTVSDTPGAWTLGGYSPNGRWGRLSWNWATCPLSPAQVSSAGGFLNLQVPGNLQQLGGQVESIRNDYWYGSYRVKILAGAHSGTDAQGSCNALFFYNSATQQEIDIEILTTEHAAKKVHFVTHPGSYEIIYVLPSDPTTTSIEYGFDWYTNKIDFFANGVKVVPSQTKGVPSTKGEIILNHWTGNTYWGGTAPPSVSNMIVDYVWHTPFLLVTYPDATGISWSKGTTKTITWNSYGDVSASNVTIEIWKNQALYQTIKSGAPNTGSYAWAIPKNFSSATNYQIKIKSALNSSYFDLSNASFAIK